MVLEISLRKSYGLGLGLGLEGQEQDMIPFQGCHDTSEEVLPRRETIDSAWDKPQEKL